jgi:hypothetical protein
MTAITRNRSFIIQVHPPMLADPAALKRGVVRGLRRPQAFPRRQGRAGIDHQVVVNPLVILVPQDDEFGR